MHDESIDRAVKQIRSLCHELAEKRGLSDEVREELCGHMEDKLMGYLKGEERVSVEDALVLVRAHFGDAERVGRELARGGSGTAERFLSIRFNHERLYLALLVIAGVATALSIPLGLLAYALRQFGLSGPTMPGGHIPTWFLPWSSLISAGFIGFILVTLTARQLNPVVGRRLTRVLNWAMLFAPPFGTMVGVYGLLMVDRGARAQAA
jgi:hypothetical protein